MTLILQTASAPSAVLVVPNAAPAWYAAYTHPRHEKKVAEQLEQRRIENFLPVYHSVRQWKDRRKELDLVLFPGYVFVCLPLSDRLRVLNLPGVVRFVTFNGQPAILPGDDLVALRNALVQGLRAENHPYLNVGRKVKVVQGPLTGARGILQRVKTNSRIVISIEAIMRSVSVEISEADVVPVF